MMRRSLFLALALASAAAYVGCDAGAPPAAKSPPPAVATAKADDHAHKAGQHGGTVVEIGRDNYHAEPVFDKDGVVRLFLLGKDEARVQEVDAQTLKAFVRAEGRAEPATVEFRPEPQPGDAPGKTSCFVARLPDELKGKAVEVTIPSVTFPDGRFRVAFAAPKGADHGEAGMPDKVSGDEEEALYLTPGGLYTAADVEANGRVTASQKFKGLKSSHNARTKAGDRICPISETKSNPQFTWVVGGKTYEFCCPPCVDEFVREAKEQPRNIKAPGEYVKQ